MRCLRRLGLVMQATDKRVPGAWLQEAGRTPMLRRNRAARRQIAMTILGRSALGTVIVAAALALVGLGVRHSTALPPGSELASHRAIYELKLAQTRGNSAVAARGRILYDFSGNACEGYALQFRQVSELDNGEGQVTLSDLRSTTWEDGAAKAYKFNSQNYRNERLVDAVDGRAERGSGAVSVTLTKPKDRKIDLEAAIMSPTERLRRI